MRIVVAIGGNAIIAEHEAGTWAEQRTNAAAVARELAELKALGHELVLTHGNGPQVGALHLQQSRGADEVPQLPFDALVAMTQGQLGYLLQMAIEEVDPRLRTATVLTRVRVEPDDPSFAEPTKPIGRFFSDERSARSAAGDGLGVAPDAGRGWRTVVPSPRPQEIIEFEHIRALVECGVLVLAAGGGGIPVVRSGGRFAGAEAVIDKDRASVVLALSVGAELLVMLTGGRADRARLRHPLAAGHGHAHRFGRRAAAGRGRVPARQHGPQGRIGGAIRPRGRLRGDRDVRFATD